MTRIVIVGGGITGLSAAWELQQRGIAYTLLEASGRLGGKIVTVREDGFVVEGGADSFLSQKPWAWQLCDELGLRDRLIGTNDDRRAVYVLRQGRLLPLPRGLRLIVPLDPDGLLESDLLTEEGKRRMLAEPEVPPRRVDGDESVADFVRRRFGPEALEVFGDSILTGIHVGDAETQSIAATFPDFVALEREYGSLIRGLHSRPPALPRSGAPRTAFVSLQGGVAELIETLQERLRGDLRTSQQVTAIDADGTVHIAGGERITAGAVILTVPARAASYLLHSVAPELASELAMQDTSSSATVSLAYRAEQIRHPLDGFGFVVPRGENTHLLASTWSSTKLPGRVPPGHVLLRVFLGGHGRAADVALPDDAMVELARHELRRVMGIAAAPERWWVFRWRAANPQYTVGHLEWAAGLAALSPPWLALAGCSFGGVGIPDCVRQGREAARRIAAAL